jgi:predicted O-linked N-acetylglucosamine transferase (SPINDLY family)
MNNLQAQLHQARALHQQGQLTRARAVFEKILKVQATNLDALNALAVIAGQSKDFKRALRLFDQALKLDPHNAALHCNRGLALHELKDLESALASYERAIELKTDYAIAYYNRGNSLKDLGRAQAALASYARAIAINPGISQAYYNRGVLRESLQDWQAALEDYSQAIALKPDYIEAYYNRGVVLQALAQWAAAVESYDKAIVLEPRHAAAYCNRGVALSRLNHSQAALESFDRAIAIRPDFARAFFNRGNTLHDLKQYAASVASFDQARALGSDAVGLDGSRRHAKMQMCSWSDYETETRELIGKIRRHEPASPPFHVLVTSASADLQRLAAEAWVRSEHPLNSMPALAKYPQRGKIRVGYFSADFHEHATLHLMAQLFEEHDRSSFDITAFSFGPDTQDAMRSRMKHACPDFYDVRLQSDADIAMLARSLQIDVAVDLKGLTQFSRPGIFACRAAPIQVSYLGYPGTLGAPYMDYLVADRTLIPQGYEHHYCERIIFMPHSYQVNDARRAIAEVVYSRRELGLPESGFVFCCFNNNFKITPDMFDVWMRILRRVEGSVLWLYADNGSAAENLRQEAARRGVQAARLIFASFMPSPAHLARHRAADLFLDTLPYNAHTTASDALWAGLPVLTCAGEAFASRVAASLLTALRMPELITSSLEDYEAMAVALANDPERLAAVKDKLARHRLSTPLFDAPLFARHLEAGYREAYARHHANLPVEHIFVGCGGRIGALP